MLNLSVVLLLINGCCCFLLDVMVLWLAHQCEEGDEGKEGRRKDDNKDVLDYIITHLDLGL